MPVGVYVRTAEHNRKISEGRTGMKFSAEHKKHIGDGRRGKKHSEETKRRMSETQKIAQNRPEVSAKRSEAQTGRTLSEEWKRRISDAKTGQVFSEERKRKISETTKVAMSRPETKKKTSEASKRNWQDSEYVQKQKEARNIKPNDTEQLLMRILQSILPNEYKYVGDFSLTIGGKNPDFVNVNSQKKIIEFFGDYWHEEDKADNGQSRIDFFKPYGYDTLVIWERELYDDVEKLKKRILKFHRKGALQKMFIGLKMRGQKILLGGKF